MSQVRNLSVSELEQQLERLPSELAKNDLLLAWARNNWTENIILPKNLLNKVLELCKRSNNYYWAAVIAERHGLHNEAIEFWEIVGEPCSEAVDVALKHGYYKRAFELCIKKATKVYKKRYREHFSARYGYLLEAARLADRFLKEQKSWPSRIYWKRKREKLYKQALKSFLDYEGVWGDRPHDILARFEEIADEAGINNREKIAICKRKGFLNCAIELTRNYGPHDELRGLKEQKLDKYVRQNRFLDAARIAKDLGLIEKSQELYAKEIKRLERSRGYEISKKIAKVAAEAGWSHRI